MDMMDEYFCVCFFVVVIFPHFVIKNAQFWVASTQSTSFNYGSISLQMQKLNLNKLHVVNLAKLWVSCFVICYFKLRIMHTFQ